MIEAVILTGGTSRRMGADKASLLVDGEPVLERIRRLLDNEGIPSTVLGPQGKPDNDPGSGPLHALAGFTPTQPYVFVCSCDLPLFDGRLPEILKKEIGEADAILPSVEGRSQPLCALYRSSAFNRIHELASQGERRIFAWTETLRAVEYDTQSLPQYGLNPRCPLGANTPDAWDELLSHRSD